MSGFEDAIGGAIGGFILTAVLSSLPQTWVINAIFIILGAGAIGVIDAMPGWSTGYLLGWIGGTLLMFHSGIISPFEMVLCLVGGIIVLAIRHNPF